MRMEQRMEQVAAGAAAAAAFLHEYTLATNSFSMCQYLDLYTKLHKAAASGLAFCVFDTKENKEGGAYEKQPNLTVKNTSSVQCSFLYPGRFVSASGMFIGRGWNTVAAFTHLLRHVLLLALATSFVCVVFNVALFLCQAKGLPTIKYASCLYEEEMFLYYIFYDCNSIISILLHPTISLKFLSASWEFATEQNHVCLSDTWQYLLLFSLLMINNCIRTLVSKEQHSLYANAILCNLLGSENSHFVQTLQKLHIILSRPFILLCLVADVDIESENLYQVVDFIFHICKEILLQAPTAGNGFLVIVNGIIIQNKHALSSIKKTYFINRSGTFCGFMIMCFCMCIYDERTRHAHLNNDLTVLLGGSVYSMLCIGFLLLYYIPIHLDHTKEGLYNIERSGWIYRRKQMIEAVVITKLKIEDKLYYDIVHGTLEFTITGDDGMGPLLCYFYAKDTTIYLEDTFLFAAAEIPMGMSFPLTFKTVQILASDAGRIGRLFLN
ncbi:hypothetical protein ACJX0J_014204 [Zea mays]